MAAIAFAAHQTNVAVANDYGSCGTSACQWHNTKTHSKAAEKLKRVEED
jgi:hypothetical protein